MRETLSYEQKQALELLEQFKPLLKPYEHSAVSCLIRAEKRVTMEMADNKLIHIYADVIHDEEQIRVMSESERKNLSLLHVNTRHRIRSSEIKPSATMWAYTEKDNTCDSDNANCVTEPPKTLKK